MRPTVMVGIGFKTGDTVWVQAGGVGWSPGEGERRPEQLRQRDPDQKGKDKPPTRGKERRKRCAHCHQLGGHLDFCETRGAA